MPDAVLVSDFDGTMTAEDFYSLAVKRLLPAEALGPWKAYLAGRMTHFKALRTIFSRIRAPEADVLAVIDAMGLDPNFPTPWPGFGRRLEVGGLGRLRLVHRPASRHGRRVPGGPRQSR